MPESPVTQAGDMMCLVAFISSLTDQASSNGVQFKYQGHRCSRLQQGPKRNCSWQYSVNHIEGRSVERPMRVHAILNVATKCQVLNLYVEVNMISQG